MTCLSEGFPNPLGLVVSGERSSATISPSSAATSLIPYTATTGLGELLQISQPEYTYFLSKDWSVGIPMHWILFISECEQWSAKHLEL